MPLLATFIAALLVAIMVGTAFYYSGARGPWSGVVGFIAVLFLGTWAIGVWADPVGPMAFGVPWLGFLATAIFIGLLIAASTPRRGRRRRHVKELPLQRDSAYDRDATQSTPSNPHDSAADGVGTATAIGALFWVFAVVAISIVLLRFLVAG